MAKTLPFLARLQSFYACLPNGDPNPEAMLGYIAPGDECELLDSHIKKDAYGYKICKVRLRRLPI